MAVNPVTITARNNNGNRMVVTGRNGNNGRNEKFRERNGGFTVTSCFFEWAVFAAQALNSQNQVTL